MSIQRYKAFIEVAETGSITKAAERLGYSQPGISHLINSLENELGFQLLIRNRERIIPTESGKRILYYCYQVIRNEESLRETASQINGILDGTIRLASFTSLMTGVVPHILKSYAEQYPNIGFITSEIEDAAIEGLFNNGIIDVAYISKIESLNISFIPLFRDRSKLIVNWEHPFAQYKTVTPDMLDECDFIMPRTGSDDIIESVRSEYEFSPNVKYYISGDASAMSMVAEGLGVSIISSLHESFLPDSVVALDFDGDYGRTLGIGIKSLKHAAPAIKELVRISRQTTDRLCKTYPDKFRPLA